MTFDRQGLAKVAGVRCEFGFADRLTPDPYGVSTPALHIVARSIAPPIVGVPRDEGLTVAALCPGEWILVVNDDIRAMRYAYAADRQEMTYGEWSKLLHELAMKFHRVRGVPMPVRIVVDDFDLDRAARPKAAEVPF